MTNPKKTIIERRKELRLDFSIRENMKIRIRSDLDENMFLVMPDMLEYKGKEAKVCRIFHNPAITRQLCLLDIDEGFHCWHVELFEHVPDIDEYFLTDHYFIANNGITI